MRTRQKKEADRHHQLTRNHCTYSRYIRQWLNEISSKRARTQRLGFGTFTVGRYLGMPVSGCIEALLQKPITCAGTRGSHRLGPPSHPLFWGNMLGFGGDGGWCGGQGARSGLRDSVRTEIPCVPYSPPRCCPGMDGGKMVSLPPLPPQIKQKKRKEKRRRLLDITGQEVELIRPFCSAG